MGAVLNREALVSPLVDVAAAQLGAPAMQEPHVPITEPVHPPAEFLHTFDRDDQVPVIAHQAVTPELHVELRLRKSEQFQKQREFLRLPKQHLPMIAPVEHVEIALLQ